jgi:hypothetical protein
MDNLTTFFQELYTNFNNRNIDRVVAAMTENVKWANGMEGGYVYGHNGVIEYWTRQFTMISSKVTPLNINIENGIVKLKVHQVVHDVNGNLLADDLVYHYFRLNNNDKIEEFNIGEKVNA